MRKDMLEIEQLEIKNKILKKELEHWIPIEPAINPFEEYRDKHGKA